MRNHKLMWPTMVLLVALCVTATVYAQAGGDFDLSWNTIDNGGGVSTGGDFGLSGTIGQAEAGVVAGTGALSGGDFQLSGGFWVDVATVYRLMLPLVVRG